MRSSVRIKKAVYTKVSVVIFFAVISAVGIFIFCIFIVNAVIRPLPDAAARKLVVVIDKLPVILKRARADAHCMAVFAKEIRLVLIARTESVFGNFFD